jgi:hypothetical protein
MTRHVTDCDCERCEGRRARNRIRMRARRARLRGLDPTAPDAPVVPLAGRVELAVRAEIDMIPGADSRPALAASAIAMGRVLDDWRVVTTWPSAQRRLMAALDALRTAGAPRTAKLATVAALSDRRPKP